MEITDRFKLVISELKARKIIKTQKELGFKLGFETESAFSQVVNGKVPFSKTLYDKIETLYPFIDIDWLIYGNEDEEQEAFTPTLISESDVQKIERNKPTAYKNYEVQTIPLYDSVATLGLKEVISGVENGNVLDYISIPNLPKSDGAIFMTGDSMYPLLKSGDIVALKIINKADIVFGEMHYVEYNGADRGTEFKVVKYVKRSEKGEDFVQLVSYNQHHEPIDINLKQIKTVAIVNASVRYNRL